MNKGLQLGKGWGGKGWTKRKHPIKKPKGEWTTKIRLIVTLPEHRINSAITGDIDRIANKVEGILIITVIPQYDIWPRLRI